jgi:hypothetical protein
LNILLVPHEADRVANHEDEFIERSALRGDAFTLKHPADEPALLLILASAAIPRTVPRLISVCRGTAISAPSESRTTIVWLDPSRRRKSVA